MALAAATTIRSFVSLNFIYSPSSTLFKRLLSNSSFHFHSSPPPPLFLSRLPANTTIPKLSGSRNPFGRPFCTAPSSSEPSAAFASPPKRNTKVNFSLSDSDSDSDSEDSQKTASNAAKEIDKSKLPPPYDPFNKKPAIEEPEDPKDLQEVFHKIRTEGLTNNAVKMFDALSKDGLTHEALQLFAQIKDKGHMPDVVAHTAVIEAYANAGQPKEAHKVYMRMLASGVTPNAYTYTVLIKAVAGSRDKKLLGEAKKLVVEMMGKGIKPNAGTYVSVFEALAKEGKADEGKEFLEELKAKGFVPDERAAREAIKDKRGPVFRTTMSILFGK